MTRYIILLISIFTLSCSSKKEYTSYEFINNTNKDLILKSYSKNISGEVYFGKTISLLKNGGTYKISKINDSKKDVILPYSSDVLNGDCVDYYTSDTLLFTHDSNHLSEDNNIFNIENYEKKKINKHEHTYTYTITQADLQ